MGDWLINDGPKWLVLIVWLSVNIILAAYDFWKYQTWDDYFYLRVLIGDGLAIARAAAAPLNFNCALILVTVCRNLITFLRGSCRCVPRNVCRQLDHNIVLHKLCAYAICFWTLIHVYSHTFNWEYFIDAARAVDSSPKSLEAFLSRLPVTDNGTNGTWINPVRSPDANTILSLISSVPGYTGVIATIVLAVMVASSTETVRRHCFEVFWFTHHLFVIFFIAIALHALGGVVRRVGDPVAHDVHYCMNRTQEWGHIVKCPFPNFLPKTAETWMWVIGPFVLYLVERLIRLVRSQQAVVVKQVVKHPSRVIELQLMKKGFRMNAGQYIFLQCPSISSLEWHPLTLTSAPHDEYFSVHVRVAGDWTDALYGACHCNDTEAVDMSQIPSFAVDGPFGTCSEDVFRYDVAMLVGAGIGVTPFASILKHILYVYAKSRLEMKLRKVYFYWICPDTNSFEWFVQLLKSLEEAMDTPGTSDFLECHIYWTRGWNEKQVTSITTSFNQEHDVITGLKHKTQFGRPNWDEIFSSTARCHPEFRIGVFFCGPEALSKTLHEKANQYSSSDPKGTHFVHNKENF